MVIQNGSFKGLFKGSFWTLQSLSILIWTLNIWFVMVHFGLISPPESMGSMDPLSQDCAGIVSYPSLADNYY